MHHFMCSRIVITQHDAKVLGVMVYTKIHATVARDCGTGTL